MRMQNMAAMLASAAMACALFAAASAYNHINQPEKVLVRATVGAGGTLWQLISDEMRKAGDDRDIREVFYETVKLNNLKNPNVVEIGDMVIIPVEVNKK